MTTPALRIAVLVPCFNEEAAVATVVSDFRKALPAAEIPKAQAWYAKTFGGQTATRNNAPVVNLPGGQIRFNAADTKQAPTRGRVLDHFGFDVNDHAAFVKRLEAEGIKLDQPVGKGATGNTITYITDPWGTRIEIVQRLPIGPQVQQTN